MHRRKKFSNQANSCKARISEEKKENKLRKMKNRGTMLKGRKKKKLVKEVKKKRRRRNERQYKNLGVQ